MEMYDDKTFAIEISSLNQLLDLQDSTGYLELPLELVTEDNQSKYSNNITDTPNGDTKEFNFLREGFWKSQFKICWLEEFKNPNYFSKLSDNIMFYIFKILIGNNISIHLILSIVNKRWNRLCNNDSLWKWICHYHYGCKAHKISKMNWKHHVLFVDSGYARYNTFHFSCPNEFHSTPLHTEIRELVQDRKHNLSKRFISLFEHEGNNSLKCVETDELRWNLLHQATFLGHISLVKFLINREVSTSKTTGKNGKTILHIAVENGFNSIVEILLKHNCDTLAKDWLNEETPFHYSIKNNNLQALKLLIESNKDGLYHKNLYSITPIELIAIIGNLDIIKYLINNYRESIVSFKDKHGRNFLMVLASLGHLHCVKYIINENIFAINELVTDKSSIWYNTSVKIQSKSTKYTQITNTFMQNTTLLPYCPIS